MMDTKICKSLFIRQSHCFPILITHQKFNLCFRKLIPFSLSQYQFKSTLLRQPDFKPPLIASPQQPQTFLTNNNTSLDVLRLFDALQLVVTPDIYASLVCECTRNGDPFQALEVYAHMKRNRWMVKYLKGSSGLLLFNRILFMFVNCGCLDFAHNLFDEMPRRNSISVAVLIAALVKNELFDETLILFVDTYECFIRHDSYRALEAAVVCALKACVGVNNVNLGKMVHGWLVKMGYGGEAFIGIAFIEFYAKCRYLSEANCMIYQQIHLDGHCDTSLWTSAIVSNCREGDFNEVIRIFVEMRQAGATMSKDMVSSILKASARVRDGSLGRQIHAKAVKSALDSQVFVMCGLVDMYGRCRLLADARKVFDTIDLDERSSSCWNAMVTCLIDHGMSIEAIKLLYQMKAAGIQPKQSLVTAVRMACGSEDIRLIPGGDILFRHTFEPG